MKDIKRLSGCKSSYEKMEALVGSRRPPHAVMIVGEKGSGKKTFALHYAMATLCKEGLPCFECKTCRKILNGNHPDIIRVRGNEKTGSISVDDIRILKQESYKVPHEGDKKVFIIEEASRLTKEAQNAFLKVLEEGPVSATYILTVSNEKEILDTVKSRVTTIFLPVLSSEDKEKAVREIMGASAPENLSFIAGCFPTVGRCVECLQDPKLKEVFEKSLKTAEYIKERKSYEILSILSSYNQNQDREKLRLLLSLTFSVCFNLSKQSEFSKKDLEKVRRAASRCGALLENNVTSSAVGAYFTGIICS